MMYTGILIAQGILLLAHQISANKLALIDDSASPIATPINPDISPLLYLFQNKFRPRLELATPPIAYQSNCGYLDKDCEMGQVQQPPPPPLFGRRNNTIELEPPQMKRNRHSSFHWPCSPMYETKLLGAGYYPKYIRSAVCDSNHCDSEFDCQPIQYKLHVLTRRLDTDAEQYNNPMLPDELKYDWKFVPVIISAACHCVRVRA